MLKGRTWGTNEMMSDNQMLRDFHLFNFVELEVGWWDDQLLLPRVDTGSTCACHYLPADLILEATGRLQEDERRGVKLSGENWVRSFWTTLQTWPYHRPLHIGRWHYQWHLVLCQWRLMRKRKWLLCHCCQHKKGDETFRSSLHLRLSFTIFDSRKKFELVHIDLSYICTALIGYCALLKLVQWWGFWRTKYFRVEDNNENNQSPLWLVKSVEGLSW